MSDLLFLPGNIAEDIVKLEKFAKKLGGKLEVEGLESETEGSLEDLNISIIIKPLEVDEGLYGSEERYIEYVTKSGQSFRIYPSSLDIVNMTEGKRIKIPRLSGIEYVNTVVDDRNNTIIINFAPTFMIEEED